MSISARTTRTLRVSVVQTCTQAYNLDATLDKLEELARLAVNRDGSQLAVFPEAFIGGYPKMSTFGAVVGERSPEGRDEYLRYHTAAIVVPSPAVSRVEDISRTTGVFLVVGVIERDGGSLYCTQIFVDPELGYMGKHRKLAPTAMERLIWGQGDGSTLPVLDQSFMSAEGHKISTKIAGAICWENYMPLLRYHYYTNGTELYCVSTVDARPVWQSTMTHIALEGRCFVLSACQYAEEQDYPRGHPVANEAERHPENVMIAGGSVIINPLGQVLAGPLLKGENVLTATIDLDDCVRGKFDLDVVGHYARPDAFLQTYNDDGLWALSPGLQEAKLFFQGLCLPFLHLPVL